MIGFLLNSKDVAVYSAAAATAGVIGSLMEATNALSAPRFAALYARKRHGELQSLFANVVRLTFWPSLMVAVILITFGQIILRLFGAEFEKGYELLIILTIGQLASAAAAPAGALLRMTGYQVLTAQVLGICAVLSVVLGVVLTQIWGNFGTAIAFSGATILCNAILMVLAIHKFDIHPLLRRLIRDL
jgi:O-antigen/teichoic acid export membrane protein